MAQGTTAVLGRIALRRVPACALPASGHAVRAAVQGGASRPATAAQDLDPARTALEAVLAYLAAA
jgi:hypothetical protein